MILNGLSLLQSMRFDICVVGSGPAGLITAFELARRGMQTLVIESGIDGLDKQQQQLADAEIVDPLRQPPMDVATARTLGGTSRIWGGRCVAFDDIDFEARPHVPYSGWPIRHEAVRKWYPAAASYLDCGSAKFSAPIGGAPASVTGECRFDMLERWSNTPNLRQFHRQALENKVNPIICLGATATGLDIHPDTGQVDGLEVVTIDRDRKIVRARAYVLACGGLETTRFLLNQQVKYPRLLGGEEGPLGRFYMGHLPGKIADIILSETFPNAEVDFFIDDSGRYVRRRINLTAEAQRRHEVMNMVAWPDNPPLFDKTQGIQFYRQHISP